METTQEVTPLAVTRNTSRVNTSSSVEVLKNKKILQFPLHLGSSPKDEYGNDQQYMMIKINTDERATKLREDSSMGKVLVSNKRSGTGIATGTESASSAKNAVDKDTITKFGSKSVDKVTWVTQKGMVRLDKVIVLPMPNSHQVGTRVTYDQNYDPSFLTKAGDLMNQSAAGIASDLFTYGKNMGIEAGVSGVLNTLKSSAGKIGSRFGPVGTAVGSAVGSAAGGVGLPTSMQDLLAEERLAINPKKEVMFNSFDFRNFSFQYTFAPKSELESETLSEIIETLRFYSLPEISSGRMFFLFPSEFEVSFMLGQADNPHIPRMTTSVLQSINVMYGRDGVWSTLPNGAPQAIDVSLNFIELELVDRKRVYEKDSPITSGF